MTPTGAVRFFRTEVESFAITAGPDGNLWFTEPNLERIGRITPAGVVSEFPPPPRVAALRQRGADGITARLRCPAAAPMVCRGTVSLEQEDQRGHARRYGVAGYAIAPGAAATVHVPLWARGRTTARGTWHPHPPRRHAPALAAHQGPGRADRDDGGPPASGGSPR